MARHEADKEDLMADATALIERAEYYSSGNSGNITSAVVTVGFRRDDSLSLYYDQDPFYQFTADGLLRRSYEGGFLYRSQTNTLAKLDRRRSEQNTTLQRSELTPPELEEFRRRMLQHVTNFLTRLESGNYQRPRCISERDDIDQRTINALQNIIQIKDRFWAGRIAAKN